MSRFSGRQGKGAMRILRDRRRAEAQERASHIRVVVEAPPAKLVEDVRRALAKHAKDVSA